MTKIVCIGEAYGESEEREKRPFVGAAGYELTRMLAEAGIERRDCFLTNVFNLRPKGNKIEAICGSKAEGIKDYPALVKGKYVPQSLIPELERLADEIVEHNPNVIIALGNTPTWALLGRTGISKIRGTTAYSTHAVTGYKVLPTYHPAAVLRQWELRPVAVFDFIKAERESHHADIKRPPREIWINPTLDDLREFEHTYLSNHVGVISVDIETSGSHITCVGFAPDPGHAIVIPFFDGRRKGKSYWSSAKDEQQAWAFVRRVLKNSTPKVFQNGLYDIAFLWRTMGIKTYNALHDTMLLHHALQPESLKGLGFLGSVYTDESNWKDMRKVETIKRDD